MANDDVGFRRDASYLLDPLARASLPSTPTNESISIRSPRGGGGTMDALFMVLLGQLAFAAALRRRRG